MSADEGHPAGAAPAPPDVASAADAASVEAQLGRAARGAWRVRRRCGLGLPIVIEAAPVLEDGSPFPTLYWLTCPLARRRISRLEQRGLVRDLTAEVARDADLRAQVDRSHAEYAAERARRQPPGAATAPRGGVGGSQGEGVKCLHAHYAHRAAGGDNPLAARIADQVEPLDCPHPCVTDGRPDPAWREPPLPA